MSKFDIYTFQFSPIIEDGTLSFEDIEAERKRIMENKNEFFEEVLTSATFVHRSKSLPLVVEYSDQDLKVIRIANIKTIEIERDFVKEWTEKTNAIGIISKAGRYGGTYAHKDIAFEFGMWISPKFKLLLIKEFERLKAEEQKQIGWNAKRELSKINYRIHTDAIKNNLVPKELTKNQINFVYAEEADVLNMALFGMTAKEWRTKNPNLDGNIRDYATMNELICLANLENLNSVFINEGLKQSERLEKLNKIAISQMQILNDTDIKYLK